MARKSKGFTITIKVDRIKELRRHSRNTIGWPGKGRKTKFTDHKKKNNKQECRNWKKGNKE